MRLIRMYVHTYVCDPIRSTQHTLNPSTHTHTQPIHTYTHSTDPHIHTLNQSTHTHTQPIHLSSIVSMHYSHVGMWHQHSSHLVYRACLPQEIHHEDAGGDKQHPALHVQHLPWVGKDERRFCIEESMGQQGGGRTESLHGTCTG